MYRLSVQLVSLALCSALAVMGGCASTSRSGVTQIERYVAPDYSGVIAVRADSQSALETRAMGLAVREQNKLNTPSTRFLIGSATKWISAVAVLRLVDAGTLNLDEPIARYLPELPAANGEVTLRQLMSNRSGIPNGFSAAMRLDRATGVLQVGPVDGALRFGTGPLDAVPGTKWNYSVTNWILIAAVVERASGQLFMDVVRKSVLVPAGAKDTDFAALDYDRVPNMAAAYDGAGARKMPSAPPMVAASGTVYSTARDLVAIADAVYRTGLLSETSRQSLSKIEVFAEDYALGGRVKTVATPQGIRTMAWESGVSGAYKTLLVYDPVNGTAFVLLNNTDIQQSEQARIATALLGNMAGH